MCCFAQQTALAVTANSQPYRLQASPNQWDQLLHSLFQPLVWGGQAVVGGQCGRALLKACSEACVLANTRIQEYKNTRIKLRPQQ